MAKNLLMGPLMGLTALFIFYSPWTAPSGSHINPAVTLTLLRLGQNVSATMLLFFIIFSIFWRKLLPFGIIQQLMGPDIDGSTGQFGGNHFPASMCWLGAHQQNS
jgi:hypothetical protein